MLIILDDSLVTADLAQIKVLSAIEHILGSHYRGENLVVASLELLEHLKANLTNTTAKFTATRITNRYSELWAVAQQPLPRLVISGESTAIKCINHDPLHWIIPVEHFSHKALGKVMLMTENQRDARIFEFCATNYKVQKRLNGFEPRFGWLPGGGSDAAHNFKAKVLENDAVVICITDSDKTHPFSARNPTASKCEKIYSQSITNAPAKVCGNLTLECREIENFVPITFMLTAQHECDAGKGLHRELEFYEALKNDRNFIEHCDMKKGLTAKAYFEETNKNFLKFWKKYFELSRNISAKCRKSTSCQDHEKCKCKIYPGLGDKALERAIQHFESTSDHKQIETSKSACNYGEWERFGKILFEWSIAGLPLAG